MRKYLRVKRTSGTLSALRTGYSALRSQPYGGVSMRLAGYSLIWALAVIGPGSAAETPKDCAAKSDRELRLSCYDSIFREARSIEQGSAASKWQTYSSKSKIDDNNIVVISVDAINAFADKYGRKYNATLNIRCMEKKTSVYVHFGGIFVAETGGYGDLTIRVDEKQAFKRKSNVATNNQSLGFWRGDGLGIAKSLLGGKSLLIAFTPYSESSQEVEFPIEGIDDAIKPVRAECKW